MGFLYRFSLMSHCKTTIPSMSEKAVGTTPEEFATRIKLETEKWAKVIRSANIKP